MKSPLKLRLLSIAAVSMLFACSEKPQSVEVTATVPELPKPPLFHPPRPQPLQLNNSLIWWRIYTKGQPVKATSFCMLPPDYKLLAVDIAEITKYLEDANDLLDYYEAQQ